MKIIDVDLWENGKEPLFNPDYGQEITKIHIYLAEGEKKRGCVVICAGGGYEKRAHHEDVAFAEMFCKAGINAAYVDYRVKPYKYPAQFDDLSRAVRYMRYNADKYNILSDKIAVCGSSAGGQNAVTVTEHFGIKEDGDEIDRVSSRPDASILCYSVSTLGPYTHTGTKYNLVGEDEKLAQELTGEKNVPDDCPPVFIWHTADDGSVPSQNALLMALALREKNIPFELHIFPHGRHGVGLGIDCPEEIKIWPKMCCDFLCRLGF